MKVGIILAEGAEMPLKATEQAGAWDVKAHRIEKKADDYYIVHTGLYLEFDESVKLLLLPRSSITNTHWIIQNSPGLGDADFTGEYQLRFRALPVGVTNNMGLGWIQPALIYPAFPFKEKDRVAQIMLVGHIDMDFQKIETIKETTRGANGYGHTGK